MSPYVSAFVFTFCFLFVVNCAVTNTGDACFVTMCSFVDVR